MLIVRFISLFWVTTVSKITNSQMATVKDHKIQNSMPP